MNFRTSPVPERPPMHGTGQTLYMDTKTRIRSSVDAIVRSVEAQYNKPFNELPSAIQAIAGGPQAAAEAVIATGSDPDAMQQAWCEYIAASANAMVEALSDLTRTSWTPSKSTHILPPSDTAKSG